jgi:hypothetical protein
LFIERSFQFPFQDCLHSVFFFFLFSWSLIGIDKARLCAQIQLEAYGKKGDSADGSLALLRLASEYSSMGEYEKSLKLLQEAKRFFALPPTQHTYEM